MKTISILLFIITIYSLSVKSYSGNATFSAPDFFNLFGGNNPHDSLLFDGEGIQHRDYRKDDPCNVLIFGRSVHGKVEGMLKRDTFMLVECGLMDTVTICEWKQVPGSGFDFLCPDDSIVTGPTGRFELTTIALYKLPFGFDDGELDKSMVGPNTVIFPKCPSYGRSLLKRGKIKVNETKEGVEKKVLETYRSLIKPKGTQYSVDSDDSRDIVRVYEGSVEINLKSFSKNREENAQNDITKLTEDLMSGKITQQEYEVKVKEFSDDYNVILTVGAGYQCTVSDKLGKVIPIENDDKWWD